MKKTRIIGAILALVLAAIGAAFVVGRWGEPQAAPRIGGSGTAPPSAAAAAFDDGDPTVAGARSSREGVRRLKSKADRERLVAFIQRALAARRAARGAAAGGREEAAADDGSEGSLSKSTIQEGVRAVIGDIKECYEQALRRAPSLEGRIVVEFEIIGEPDAGGVIERAEIGDGTDAALRSEQELNACIIDSIYTIELPRPKDGGRVTVEYPFYLSPKAEEGE